MAVAVASVVALVGVVVEQRRPEPEPERVPILQLSAAQAVVAEVAAQPGICSAELVDDTGDPPVSAFGMRVVVERASPSAETWGNAEWLIDRYRGFGSTRSAHVERCP